MVFIDAVQTCYGQERLHCVLTVFIQCKLSRLHIRLVLNMSIVHLKHHIQQFSINTSSNFSNFLLCFNFYHEKLKTFFRMLHILLGALRVKVYVCTCIVLFIGGSWLSLLHFTFS